MLFDERHHMRVCKILNKYKDKIEPVARIGMIGKFKAMFANDNPEFDSQRFMECVYGNGK